MISKMKVDELKHFLKIRNLKSTGKKEALVARVFVALENNVKPVPTAEMLEKTVKAEYKSKLEELGITDPWEIKDGWLSEESGIHSWPMVTYGNIFNFLMFFPSELGSADLNDYKTSKAYSYFKSGWLGQIKYHTISSNSAICLMKSDCIPFKNFNDKEDNFHKIWVCVNKESGCIKGAHCTCMQGALETCNHVAALLFRVEAAVTTGLTNPSCTSKPCEWLPKRQKLKPMKLDDIDFSRDTFSKNKKKRNANFV